MTDVPRGITTSVDLDQERAAAVRRNRLKTYPGRLLFMVANEHETEHVTREQIREIAMRRWRERLPADEIDEIVAMAIAERDEEPGGRRIDPETVDLTHPSRRDTNMVVTKNKLKAWLTKQLKAQPNADNDELERRATEELGAGISRRSLGQIAGVVRRELEEEAKPSTNGGQPPTPPVGNAEPVGRPATEPIGGVVEERPGDSAPGEQLHPAKVPAALEAYPAPDEFAAPELSIERSLRTPGRMDVRVSLLGVPPALALRVGAALANAAEFELREGAAA